jgi:uncharacterized protein YuzE
MKLNIDREADALHLALGEGPVAESKEVAPGVVLDYGSGGMVIGIEILDLSRRVSPPHLDKVEVEPRTLLANERCREAHPKEK